MTNAKHLPAKSTRSLRSMLLRPAPTILGLFAGVDWQADEVKRVLLVRPDHIGDVLLTTPALNMLRANLPGAHITFLVGPWSRRVVEGNPNVDEVLVHDFSWFNRREPRNIVEPYLHLLRLIRSLRDRNFDLAINLRFDFWLGALLTKALGIPRRIGYDVTESRPFLTETIGYAGKLHEAERNLRLVRAACEMADEQAWKTVSCSLDFNVTSEEHEFAESYLRSHGVGSGDTLVALHPGSGWPTKRWKAERFAEVGDELARRLGTKVILTGTGAELSEVLGIVERMKQKAIIAAGETTLGQLAATLQRCALVVGVDSGALHLAVAMGTPSVHLFGPSDCAAFGPCGAPDKHVIVRTDMSCAPCGEMFHCARGGLPSECMRSLSTEDVIEAAYRALSSRARVSERAD